MTEITGQHTLLQLADVPLVPLVETMRPLRKALEVIRPGSRLLSWVGSDGGYQFRLLVPAADGREIVIPLDPARTVIHVLLLADLYN